MTDLLTNHREIDLLLSASAALKRMEYGSEKTWVEMLCDRDTDRLCSQLQFYRIVLEPQIKNECAQRTFWNAFLYWRIPKALFNPHFSKEEFATLLRVFYYRNRVMPGKKCDFAEGCSKFLGLKCLMDGSDSRLGQGDQATTCKEMMRVLMQQFQQWKMNNPPPAIRKETDVNQPESFVISLWDQQT